MIDENIMDEAMKWVVGIMILVSLILIVVGILLSPIKTMSLEEMAGSFLIVFGSLTLGTTLGFQGGYKEGKKELKGELI